MASPRVSAGGGLPALLYVWRKSREAGGVFKMYRRLRSKNACKTCAVGMGGERGGMVNEAGHFPEVCKKSVQAQAADMMEGPGEEYFATTTVAELERLSSLELEKLGRLTFPLLLEPGRRHFRRITWEDAMTRVAAALSSAPAHRTFFYSSGRSSNEAAFLFQLVARAYGTNNVSNCSFYCHNASSVALSQMYGSGAGSVTLDDLGKSDLALVAGANPASNHPRLISQLVKLRRRGGKVIVVNPLRELGLVRFRVPSDAKSFLFGSQVSDLYLQPNIGGDLWLFMGLLKCLIELNYLNTDFIKRHTSGWRELAADVATTSFHDLERESGVSEAQMREASELLGKAQSGILCWAMGLTHQPHGTDTIQALANLALVRGWLGKPGAGLLPIRGHSNVQGVGSVGVSPTLKSKFQTALSEIYGISSNLPPGQDTFRSMTAAAEGEMDTAVLLGGNLLGANPDRAWAERAMQNIGTCIYLSTKLNLGHVHGRGKTTLLLPVLTRDEESQATTQESMFSLVRLSEGGQPAVAGEMRSEVAIISDLAQRILPPGRYDWSRLASHAELRRAMSEAVPGYESARNLGPGMTEFHVEGRAFHEPRFPTSDERAHFQVPPRPKFDDDRPFRLMTLRSEGQFNTVVYEDEDLYRGQVRRDVVMMSEHDAGAMGVAEGDRVLVQTSVGQMPATVSIVPIRAGNLAMYYPEANVLVPRRLDPRSHTPAFKFVFASVRLL